MTRFHASIRLLGVTAGYGAAFVLARRAMNVSLTSPWFVLTAMISVLGWLAMARPLWLPRLPRWLRTVRAWEQGGTVYRALGVSAFGELLRRTPLRALNRDVYASRYRRDPATLAAQLEAAEAAHLLDAVLVVPYMVYAGTQAWWAVVLWFAVAQIVVNVYPVLHLRSARGRLTGRLDRLNRRHCSRRPTGRAGSPTGSPWQ
jgi:hypothetical protein